MIRTISGQRKLECCLLKMCWARASGASRPDAHAFKSLIKRVLRHLQGQAHLHEQDCSTNLSGQALPASAGQSFDQSRHFEVSQRTVECINGEAAALLQGIDIHRVKAEMREQGMGLRNIL